VDAAGARRVIAATSLLRVQPCTGLARPLLELELLGAVVPVGDLLGEAVLHRGAGLLDPLEPAAAHLGDVVGHHLRDGMAERLLLDALARGARNPGALRPSKQVVHRRLTLGQRAVVEVGRILQMPRLSRGIQLDVEQTPRDGAALARGQDGHSRFITRDAFGGGLTNAVRGTSTAHRH
jgi:hypothetical protein